MLPAPRSMEEADFQFHLCIRAEQQTLSDDFFPNSVFMQANVQGFPFTIPVNCDSGNYLQVNDVTERESAILIEITVRKWGSFD